MLVSWLYLPSGVSESGVPRVHVVADHLESVRAAEEQVAGENTHVPPCSGSDRGRIAHGRRSIRRPGDARPPQFETRVSPPNVARLLHSALPPLEYELPSSLCQRSLFVAREVKGAAICRRPRIARCGWVSSGFRWVNGWWVGGGSPSLPLSGHQAWTASDDPVAVASGSRGRAVLSFAV